MNLLYEDFGKINWDNMPFPRKWAENVLCDKVDGPRGYLKARAFDHSDQIVKGVKGPITSGGKLIHEQSGDNQVMYWLKHAFAMLEGGIHFKDDGEHLGYEDGGETFILAGNHPEAWKYISSSGVWVYSTHVWKTTTDSMAITTDISPSAKLYPFFPTKMRFGTAGPVDITTAINPDETTLDDPNAQGAGNLPAPKLNFIIINRTTHIALTTTGYSLTAPSGYYADYGAVFKNITVYQVTMPASATAYVYDGKALNEAGLYCDASLTGTRSGLYEMPNGMILTKRYFSPIQKTNTISINFQWSLVK
jgi:hypothetical protein